MKLDEAIKSLGAVCVRSGITETVIGGDGKGPDVTTELRPALYALKGNSTGRWRVLAADKIFHGCTPTALTFVVSGVEMPAWWGPAETFLLRNIEGKIAAVYITRESALLGMIQGDRLFTADLETGAEVPA
jgi:hypothetical protein